MSVAEKFIAQGRVEGQWIGRIQALEEFLGMTASTTEMLQSMEIEALEAMHERLHREYEARFKRP